MTWKRLVVALLLGVAAIPAAFAAAKPILISHYMQVAPHDGQSAISVFAGSLYLAVICGVVTFAFALLWGRQRRQR